MAGQPLEAAPTTRVVWQRTIGTVTAITLLAQPAGTLSWMTIPTPRLPEQSCFPHAWGQAGLETADDVADDVERSVDALDIHTILASTLLAFKGVVLDSHIADGAVFLAQLDAVNSESCGSG